MKKLTSIFLTLILLLALVGCGETEQEQEQLRVFSFSGENQQFTVTNGIIVLDDIEEIFSGGDLKASDNFFSDVASCTATFYIMAGSERRIILSNSVIDMTGGFVDFEGDLGQISGNGVLVESKIEKANDWENNLYFELTTTDKNGDENVYQLHLSVNEITQAND